MTLSPTFQSEVDCELLEVVARLLYPRFDLSQDHKLPMDLNQRRNNQQSVDIVDARQLQVIRNQLQIGKLEIKSFINLGVVARLLYPRFAGCFVADLNPLVVCDLGLD